MATNSKNTKQTDTETATKLTHALGADRLHEDDVSTLGNDELEPSLNTPTIDKQNLCWGNFPAESHDTSIVFEGWEIISVRPTTELASFKRMFGVDIVSTYKVMKDGYTGVRAIPSYSQVELVHAVATAEREWASKASSLMHLTKQDTYGQNLARRIFELPACLPSKLGALLDCRFVATNKNPHIRREWKIVMLKPIFEVLTDEGKPYNLGLWNMAGRKQSDPVQKWLVILRGRDTRVSKKCFQAFNTMSNPWLKVDERPQHAKENITEQHEGSEERQ
ncbi:hypothetical protein E0Z10_g255 [Xylaria hypoxylon]|uniref:Uncharacterized protein n=1 Tax=Xylaria hypoxylon TaxID=37992 RepID=A0A4Z0ZBU3_9PEZI|nr:hypothetical protein E0Z10_g255 [Xylaria hypoxylon]